MLKPRPMILLFLLPLLSSAFNLDEGGPIWAEVPSTDETALFGYSLALNQSEVYVGAPGYQRSGAVFKCTFNDVGVSKAQCSKIGGRASQNREFLGGSLTLTGGDLLACAQRSRAEVWQRLSNTTGNCYSYNTDNGNMREFFRLRNPDLDVGWTLGWKYMTMLGQASVISSEGDLVLGLPMARRYDFDWDDERMTGHFMKVDLRSGSISLPSYKNVGWGTYTHSTLADPHTVDLTGTAIVRGRFFYEGNDHYVLGAPKANRLRGRIYLCPDCFNPGTNVRRINSGSVIFDKNSLQLEGFQFGSRYGQTLGAVNINGDHYDDLVVGAPLWSDRDMADTGNVFVYKTIVDDGTLRTELRLMTGAIPLKRKRVSGARFGAAIASLGDLDGDGYQEFAVGAPGEGDGAVYVYRGSRIFRFQEEPQKLTPATFGVSVRRFGSSIAASSKIGQVGRPGVAIGAIDPGKVVILKALEVVRLSPNWKKPEIPAKAVNPKVQSFQITITAGLQAKVNRHLLFTLRFHAVDPRIQLPSQYSTNETTVKFAPSSSSRTFRIDVRPAKPNFGVDLNNVLGVPKPIVFHTELEWELSTDNCNRFGCPILDPRSDTVQNFEFQVPLQTGCDDNDNCKCNLKLVKTARFLSAPIEIVVGESKTLTTQITARNDGNEPAYNNHLRIQTEKPIDPPRQLDCKNATDDGGTELGVTTYLLSCKFPSLNSQSSRTVDLDFDFSGRQDVDLTRLTVNMTLISSCARSTQSRDVDLTMTTEVTFKYVTEMEFTPILLNGIAPQVEYNDTNLGFEHNFKIKNNGPSPVQGEYVYHLLVPDVAFVQVESLSHRTRCKMASTSMRVSSGQGAAGAGGRLVSCATERCSLYRCTVPERQLLRGEELNVQLRLMFDAGRANEDEDYTRYSVRSLIKGGEDVLSYDTDFVGMTTEFYRIDDSLAWMFTSYWPYVIGGLIGLVLLTALALLLWKMKAFSKMRVFKKQMDEAEAEDKRQSQMAG